MLFCSIQIPLCYSPAGFVVLGSRSWVEQFGTAAHSSLTIISMSSHPAEQTRPCQNSAGNFFKFSAGKIWGLFLPSGYSKMAAGILKFSAGKVFGGYFENGSGYLSPTLIESAW